MATQSQKAKQKTPAKPEKNAALVLKKNDPNKPPKNAPGVTVVEDWEIEIIPRSAGIVRLNEREGGSVVSLSEFENAIKVSIAKTIKAETFVAVNSVLIGVALGYAELMIKTGYVDWVKHKFGDLFGERKGRYCKKLGEAFRQSEAWKKLEVPPVREMGGWLVRSYENESPLNKALGEFVGDMNLSALMEKHGVMVPKAKKEWEPSDLYVKQYTQMEEHKHLADTPYLMWAVNEKEAFKAWYDEETKDDTKHHSTKAETSLKTWVRIGEDLIEHGLTEKTWVYLPNKERENVLDILKDVVHEMENMKEE